jgi:isopenicillin-N epimerase
LSGALSVPAAIEFHRRHLTPAVRDRCHTMAGAQMQRVAGRFRLPVIGRDDDFAQMTPLPVPAEGDADALRERLFSRHGIEVPVTQHAGRRFVRLSVQGYNGDDDLERLHAALEREFAGG